MCTLTGSHPLKLDLAVHMWLRCHGDSVYRLDDQWLRGKCVSTKQLVYVVY